MAIVQISRITNRKGLEEDLPQLAGAELGWATDTRRLYIGNGTLADGAPVVGNTEVLTEFSDVLNLAQSYTYKDSVVGYTVSTGPTPNDPVTRSIQAKLDDIASVRDFGAVGDGTTDDTEAINRALYQLYCRETNAAIRRTLYFPAGIYKIAETIIIPPYARLVGDGNDASIIQLDVTSDLSTTNSYVARTGDSLQQIGNAIGSNGAIIPQSINIEDLCFNTVQNVDVFLIDQTNGIYFKNVRFSGSLTTTLLSSGATRGDIAGVRYYGTSSNVCTTTNFDNCIFTGLTYALITGYQIKGASLKGCYFNILYRGVILGDTTVYFGGPTGVSITNNTFDNIFSEGVLFLNVELNCTGFNIFYDVGNHFQGIANPFAACISFELSDFNASIGDLFERDDTYAQVVPRISSTGYASTELNSEQLKIGRYARRTGLTVTLQNNVGPIASTITSFSTINIKAATLYYTIVRGNIVRSGALMAIAQNTDDSSGTFSYTDDYTENSDIGVTMGAEQTGSTVYFKYLSANLGTTGTIYYSLDYFS